MPRLLGLLPALLGIRPAEDAALGLRSDFARTDPPSGAALLSGFPRHLHLAGTPRIVTLHQARPLVEGAILATRCHFTTGTAYLIRESF
ncbi:hypothetical protein [Pseudoroseomonas ludipueritiae]|uniref:UTRA domain-containing protein n=1 Tax=Pseudoroseomonas ludipueritiae TaxID=198093 RepID=A0ABR7R7T7_9PROT|nr:hypothetical protein [Pseudoroseomonas ludipueritiae]MBC9177844.1 hypothetical protein [Pseudoroseomonas ludipueritiae]MCG7363186.1 hypothetical protein [Roseomonas sp. ACRSG]